MAQKVKTTSPVKITKATKAPILVDSFSYAVGLSIASNMQEQGVTGINYADLQKGMDAIFKNQTKLMEDNQINMTIQQKLQEFMAKKIAAQCVLNGIITDWFLFAEDRLRIAPPLCITMEELEIAVDKIKLSIDQVLA